MKTGPIHYTQSLSDLNATPESGSMPSAMRPAGAPVKNLGPVVFNEKNKVVEYGPNPFEANKLQQATASRQAHLHQSLITKFRKNPTAPAEPVPRPSSATGVFTHSSLRKLGNRIRPGAGDRGAQLLANKIGHTGPTVLNHRIVNKLVGRELDPYRTFQRMLDKKNEKTGFLTEIRNHVSKHRAIVNEAMSARETRSELLADTLESLMGLKENSHHMEAALGSAMLFQSPQNLARFAEASVLGKAVRKFTELRTDLPIANDMQFAMDLRMVEALANKFPDQIKTFPLSSAPPGATLLINEHKPEVDPQALKAFQSSLAHFDRTYLESLRNPFAVRADQLSDDAVIAIPPVSNAEVSGTSMVAKRVAPGAESGEEQARGLPEVRHGTRQFLQDVAELRSNAHTLLDAISARHKKLQDKVDVYFETPQLAPEYIECQRHKFATTILDVLDLVHEDAKGYVQLEAVFEEAAAIGDTVIANRVIDGKEKQIRLEDLARPEGYVVDQPFNEQETDRIRKLIDRLDSLIPRAVEVPPDNDRALHLET